MDTLYSTYNYLSNLEWTERKQTSCIFCDRKNFNSVVYEDGEVIAVENIRAAGERHFLILPFGNAARHIRDIEALGADDLDILEKFELVKHQLLNEYYPNIDATEVHCGYHRGRRPMIAASEVFWPDIVSIHHLHMHVIVRPSWSLKLFKYPSWMALMWKTDDQVLEEVRQKVKLAVTEDKDSHVEDSQ